MFKIISLSTLDKSSKLEVISNPIELTLDQIVQMLEEELDDDVCAIARSSKGGGGGQTLIFENVVIKNPGKKSEQVAAELYTALGEKVPTTYLIQSDYLNTKINKKIVSVKDAQKIPDGESLLLMSRINGKNLSEFLESIPDDILENELKFIGYELGRIAIKDIITGNWDRIISLS